MRMRRHLRPDQGHGVLAKRLALRPRGEPGTLAGAAGAAPAKVGQSEGRFAVAAVLGAQPRKQSGVLRDRHQRAVSLLPASRCEIEADPSDLTNYGFCSYTFF